MQIRFFLFQIWEKFTFRNQKYFAFSFDRKMLLDALTLRSREIHHLLIFELQVMYLSPPESSKLRTKLSFWISWIKIKPDLKYYFCLSIRCFKWNWTFKQKVHFGMRFECVQCNKKFITKSLMKKHFQQSHSTNPTWLFILWTYARYRNKKKFIKNIWVQNHIRSHLQ